VFSLVELKLCFILSHSLETVIIILQLIVIMPTFCAAHQNGCLIDNAFLVE